MNSHPTTITCNECFYADDVTCEVNYLTGQWDYQCSSKAHGESPHIWSVDPPKAGNYAAPRDGEMADLGVYDDLLLCVHADDPWLEYGVVEDRYRRQRPDTYASLVAKYSHSARNAIRGGPDVNPDRKSKFSVRLASALSHLEGAGLIAKNFGPATGFWDYNGIISRWAPLPSPATENVLSWWDYAVGNGLDPTKWILP
jgi:hypothetical protein